MASCLMQQCGVIRQKTSKELFGLSSEEQFMKLLYSLLKFDPEKRPTAERVMKHPYFREFYRE